MRLLGAGLVIFSCGAMGLIIAASYGQRVKNLLQFASFLQCLESEMNFAQATLPEIVLRQKGQSSGILKSFLQALSRNLQAQSGENFAQVWRRSLVILADGGFPPLLLSDLQDLGNILGQSDLSEQSKHLVLLQTRLEQALAEARAEQGKHTKLWNYLGFFAGLLIVLLLF